MRTNETLKEIALGLYKGEIFTSMQVPEHETHLLPVIFMPLMAMSTEDLKSREEVPYVVFSHMKHTLGSRGINGFPIFSACEFLTKEEFDIVAKYHKEITEKVKAI